MKVAYFEQGSLRPEKKNPEEVEKRKDRGDSVEEETEDASSEGEESPDPSDGATGEMGEEALERLKEDAPVLGWRYDERRGVFTPESLF